MNPRTNRIYYSVLIVVHFIGLGLFLSPNRPEGLSGLNMLFCAVLVYCSATDKAKELVALLGIVLGGFIIECVGANTGLLFGQYEYGDELGFKLYNVPIVLGLNWYCVIVASTQVIMRWGVFHHSIFIQALLSAFLAVVLDYWIEPVAMQYDFWNWEGGIVPFYNYACWYVFAAIFSAWYLSKAKQHNSTAYFLFWLWLAFFYILNTLLIDSPMEALTFIIPFFLAYGGMEFMAWFTHKYIMHGVLWFLHKDHHQPNPTTFFEKNDVFFLVYAIPSWLCIMLGMMYGHKWVVGIGFGILAYGVTYFLVHDVLIHRRFKWFDKIQHPYFKALRKAHKVHHKNRFKEEGTCFGLLIVPWKFYKEQQRKG